ncbi:DUF4476 domain-containing protein [Adhaeribacter soli]|uniref:DUF4476 domain-containing protein n=1 Tax=Adhaeribacter soli TaxID=2607655 RepID=A0A5N1J259_9BACT|nr:DUF4476 domain-containing protein [Adhaeribacter soli]KAA9340669.1 DUF4476 domain-containing protein [Adhaeribacter soli]
MQKKIVLFLMFLLSSASILKAQFPEDNPYNGVPSHVTVFAKDGDKFWLILNGEKQNEKPAANVKIGNLTSGDYKIKVIFENSKIPSLDDRMYARDYDNNALNVVYEIKKNKKGNAMVMRLVSAEITGKPNPKRPRPQLDGDFDQFDKPQNSNQAGTNPAIPQPVPGQKPGQVPMPVMTTKDNVVEVNDGQVTHQTNMNTGAVTITDNATGKPVFTNNVEVQPANPGKPVPASGAAKPTPAGCSKPMADATFQTQLASIKKQNFSDTKMKVAKTMISKNCLSTNQVTAVLNTLSMESDKVQMAKFAYPYTIDKENYLTITDIFKFSSSTSELTKFLDAQ